MGQRAVITVTCDWPRCGEWRTIDNDQEPETRSIPTGWAWVDLVSQGPGKAGEVEASILCPQHANAIRGLLNGELSPSVLLVTGV